MESLTLYLIFCITTSICFIYEIVWPAICNAKQENVQNSFTENTVLSLFIFFIINLILAPVIIFTLFIPHMFAHTSAGINKAIKDI